jgi:tripartite-type tricarboxylate transporter receptor subunit TctC
MKKIFMATFSAICIAGLLTAAQQSSAASLDWPKKTIQVYIPYKPGGDTDMSSRIMAKHTSKALGKSVVIVNLAGASGSLAPLKVKDARPDGYTALYYHPSFFMNKLMDVIDFDHNAFEIVAIPSFADSDVICVNSKSDIKTIDDLVNKAKANPKSIKYAASLGNYSYIQGVAIEDATGVKFNKVDIGGGSDKLQALLGGHLDVSVFTINMIRDYVDTGELRVLAQFAPERSEFITDYPTLKESKIDVSFKKFYFLALPKGTPQEIVTAFAEGIKAGTTTEEARKEYHNLFLSQKFLGPKEAKKYLDEQFKYYEKLAQAIEK